MFTALVDAALAEGAAGAAEDEAEGEAAAGACGASDGGGGGAAHARDAALARAAALGRAAPGPAAGLLARALAERRAHLRHCAQSGEPHPSAGRQSSCPSFCAGALCWGSVQAGTE